MTKKMGTEIIITGVSGRFPESDNIAEFSSNLYNKINLVTQNDRRWEPGLHGLPKCMGCLKDISKFDASFFGVHAKQAHLLDPQARMLLELTHEAIVDAGYDPEELRGKRIGVFIGNCSSESDEFFSYDPKKINGYAMTGCCRAMFANRISYTFDFKGPSFLMDTACSSGAFALYSAVEAIQNGECEAAIVGGANLCLRPATALQFYKLNMLSDDGKCKSFDAACNGYGRSEAIVSMLLQKSDVARRSYATIVHIKSNTDGYKEQGVTFPSAKMQKQVIEEVYKECKVNPLEVSYVEAHGTGTPAGDPIEMSAIAEIFCKGREEPLLVGSVKSNMGHSEPTSGLCGVVKVLIGMQNSLIPPNLHFSNPNPDIPALLNGQVKIVSEATPWNGGYAAISCFGFGGVNVHTLLKSNCQQQLPEKTENTIPQLALYAGRTEESIDVLFDYLDKESVPRDFFALLHKSVYSSPTSKPFRGFKVIGGDDQVSAVKQVSSSQRPVWYVFSGMGTQWPAMAKHLMNLEVFANSIRRSAEVLKPFGIDLVSLVTNGEGKKENARSIIPAFVSIAAVQVALVDVLTELGINPDGIVGHSVGELGCAYADGCFTAEQMVLAAFWRGKAVEESNLEEGSMAAIGLTWDEAKKLCPPKIFPSCHNAEDSVTISGPKDEVKTFVEFLKSQNTFAREVDSCGYAFHSEYIFPAAGKLQAALEKAIPSPKPRTSRWISSSVPQERWNEPIAKEASAAYFVHNLVSPVLFHEALRFVPEDAIVIEIAPHHLLQAILKRVIGPKAEYIGLMKRQVNNAVYLLSSIGRLYTSGLNPDIERLYPKVNFPVSGVTPMISSLIRWDHEENWTVAKWDSKTGQSSQMFVEVDLTSDSSEDMYLLGHCIDGRYLYPATGYLMLAWKALAEMKGKDVSVLPVVFENVKIHRATVLSRTAITRFLVDITSAGGDFEISEAGMTVASGRIYVPEDSAQTDTEYLKNVHNGTKLNSDDIYKELRLRGYDYGPTFQGVVESDLEGKYGLLKWTGDWVVFLDTILQFSMLKSLKRALYLPTRIQSVKVDPLAHKRIADEILKTSQGIPIIHETYTNTCKAGGVEIKNLKATFAPRHQSRQIPLLEEYHFVPYSEVSLLPEPKLSELVNYIHVCSSLSKKILESAGKKEQISDVMNGFAEADDSIISSYLNAMSDEHVLLKTLKGILSSSNEDVLKAARSSAVNYLKEREKDIIKNTLVAEVPLRNVLDIVAENISSRKLKVLEISNATVPLSAKVQSHFRNFSLLQVNYIIAHPNPDSLEKAALSASNVKTVKWSASLPVTADMKDIDLLVLRDLHCSKKDLNSLFSLVSSTLQTKGFILLLQQNHLVPGEMLLSALGDVVIPTHTESELEHVFKASNFEVVCKKGDELTLSLYLLRGRKDTSHENDVVVKITEDYDQWVDPLKDELVKSQANPGIRRIWVVGEGTPSNGIVGLVNCLRQEPGGSDLRCVYLDVTEGPKIPAFSLKDKFYKDLSTKDIVMNVYKRGVWGSFRHISVCSERNNVTTEHAYCNVLTRGDLSSLKWVDSPVKYFSSDISMKDKVLCQVYYAPLNFRDVMLASGKLPPDAIPGDLVLKDSILGLEFSGRDMTGKRVMGVLSHQGLATAVAADPEFVWDVPHDWTLEQASTVPVAYSTAYYALLVRGNLRRGERILIHSGSGGVGQAAISIALSLGCEVFTTVGSLEKKEFLKKRFPQLKDENFCNSRDLSFETHILNATKGKGVQVVLNSLADEKLKASLNCLAEHGRFLEIGKYDLSNNTPLGMAVFLKNISFHGILLDAVFGGDTAGVSTKKEIVNLVNEGIRNGTVKPLNSILFAHEQIEDAFRFMASGRHIGKVVIKVKTEEPERTVVPSPVTVSAIPRTICHPNKIYVIVGGLGGFGLELCQWLVDRGARRIILTSRSGVRSGYQHLCLKRWKHEQIDVEVSKLNVANYEEAQLLLSKASSEGTVAGIFNLGMVLRDAFMENQTAENFRLVCESKVQGTTNLDVLSQVHCPELEWFVCFSSVSCGRGNAGQSNYGYANSVMERICERRRKEGLPGLAVQWGAVGDVGVIQDTVGGEVVIGGTVPQRITSCLSVLDQFIQQEHPVVSSFVPYQQSVSKTEKSSKHKVIDAVAHIFGIKDPSTINVDITLGEMGMDSLMGVEIQQFLERDHELVLSIQELRQMKIKDLKKLDGDENISEDEQCVPEGGDSIPNGLLVANSEHEIKLSNYLLVPTHTLVNMNGIEKGTPLFIIHPIEGVVSMLSELGKLIQNPAYGIQCTKDTPCTSVEDLASWYLEHIKNMGINEPFHLAGYSFGASVAFEMALQAENQTGAVPTIKSLTMLDGSPALVTTYAKETESRFLVDSQTEGEVYALYAFTQQYTDINVRELKTELFQLPSFEDRVTFVANKLVAAVPQMSVEDVSVAAKLYYKKLLISLKYTPKSKLKKNVLLIKASDTFDRMLQFSELYDLEKVCEGKVDVHTVKGTHKSFLQGEGAEKISKIMNSLCTE